MLAATGIALWLILQPPGGTDSAAPVVVGRLTPTARSGAAQPTVAPQTPDAATPEPSPGEAAPTPTEAPFNEHIVQLDDTLYGIAAQYLAEGDDLDAFARAIASLNGLDFDNPTLAIGSTILLPKPQSEQDEAATPTLEPETETTE
jgi:hypothetical protein